MSSNPRFTSSSTLNNSTAYPAYSYTIPDRIPRRRKRPSHRSRERKTQSRYDNYADSISIALDQNMKLPTPSNPSIPGNQSNPSPLLRKNFDQSWLRWKEKERELARENEMLLREKEMVFMREEEMALIREEEMVLALGGEEVRERDREAEERRIFGGVGGESGDDGSLCPKMLEVVRFLFGGDVDFGYLDKGDD